MHALDGIKVLDLTHNIPGSFCTMILGDLGADILKVQQPMDPKQAQLQRVSAGISSPRMERERATTNPMERNKRSIVLNLKHEDAQQVFHRLSEGADVVLEGNRPGVVKRLGVDYDTIQEVNPRIVYCSISGYGQDGPYKNLVGHDINYISLAGMLGMIGNEEDGKPAIPFNYLADYAGGGLYAAVGILSAIIAREKTGCGQYIDIAMSEGVFYMMGSMIADYFSKGTVPRKGEMPLTGGRPHYNTYETQDGKYLSIAALEPWFWANLCRTLGREDLIIHQQAEGEKKQEVVDFLTETFKKKTRDEWFEFLKEKDIAVGKVYSLDEVMTDPQITSRGMLVEVLGPDGVRAKQPGISIRMSDTPGDIRSTGSVMGQHTREVLLDLGYTEPQIETLRQQKAVQ